MVRGGVYELLNLRSVCLGNPFEGKYCSFNDFMSTIPPSHRGLVGK